MSKAPPGEIYVERRVRDDGRRRIHLGGASRI